jgi:hypothetical protein
VGYEDDLQGMARIERAREHLQPDAERLQAWGEQRPDVFGGLWWDDVPDLDNPPPGSLTVAVAADLADDLAAVREELDGLLEHPDGVHVGVPHDDPALAHGLRERYGPDRVDVVRQDAVLFPEPGWPEGERPISRPR